KDVDRAAAMLRQYVSGFANADGGVLVVGYDSETTKQIDGAKAPGKSTLKEWAGSVVGTLPIAAPRLVSVSTPQGDVLLVATQRSRVLVPCNVAGRQVYYYRFGHSTSEMPQSLLFDLQLGRRAVSEMGVSVLTADWIRSQHYYVPTTKQMA